MPLGVRNQSDQQNSDIKRVVREMLKRDTHEIGSAVMGQVEVQTLKVTDNIEFAADLVYVIGSAGGAPAFQNSWAHYGAPYGKPAFWKDKFGIVHVEGWISGGTVNQTAFTLPAGFRPQNLLSIVVLSNNLFGRLDISTDGRVVPVDPAVTDNVSLDNIQFRSA